MKIVVTKEQLELLRENDSKKFSCEGKNCEHSWDIKKEDKHPYLCHMCGYDSHKKKYNYDELENFWKNYKKEEEVTEKYKKNINCNNPKGFSQRAHCQGRKKRLKESKNIKEVPEENKKILSAVIELATPEIKKILNDENITITYEIESHRPSVIDFYTIITTLNILDKNGNTIKLSLSEGDDIIDILFDYLSYMGEDQQNETYDYSFDFKKYHIYSNLNENKEDELEKNGYDIKGIKTAIKIMSQLSETYGEGIPLEFTLHDYYLKKNDLGYKPVLQLIIDIDEKDGNEYKLTQMYRHEISLELLNVLEMLGLYNDEKMSPYYNFHFNKRSLE